MPNEEMRSRIKDLQKLAAALTDVEDYAANLENTLILQEARIRCQQILIQVAAARQADLMADYDSLLDANRRQPRVSDCHAIRDRYDARQQVHREQALDSSLPRLRALLVPDIVDLTSSRTGTASTEEDDHNSSEQDAARALLYYANLTVEESPQELMTIPQFENRVNELLERQTNVQPSYTRSRLVRLRADSVNHDETSSPRAIRPVGKRRIESNTRTETRRTRLREA